PVMGRAGELHPRLADLFAAAFHPARGTAPGTDAVLVDAQDPARLQVRKRMPERLHVRGGLQVVVAVNRLGGLDVEDAELAVDEGERVDGAGITMIRMPDAPLHVVRRNL